MRIQVLFILKLILFCIPCSWLEHLTRILDTELQGTEAISWAAYHAQSQQHVVLDSDVSLKSLLPLFHHEAKSVAMICHCMNIVRSAVEIVNSTQVPVIACDQPLYALAKQIQWSWPSTYGEDRYVVMFGGLHIEMVALKMLGDLLEDSGWTGALVRAGITTSGVADSFLKGAHVTRTRRAHQVTASSLFLLMKEAYDEYARDANEVLAFKEWCDMKASACPQFLFWQIVLQLELHVLLFVRSIREGDFHLYIAALKKLVPWCFALDHINYARWLPVHLKDMISLEKCHPDVFKEFMNGKFVVKKSQRAFSALAIDQAHEQQNALVKGDGGAVGLTSNPAALHRWMVSGPEMARLINEFQASSDTVTLLHHEQKKSKQLTFANDVKALTQTIKQMGNPFCEDSSDLLVLDSHDIADVSISETIRKIEKLGLEQYEQYVEERLHSHTLSIAEPIKKNSLHLFSRPPVRQKSAKQLQVSSLKSDCSLFSRLYIASQTRDGDLDEFFKHENQVYPPALSQVGVLRSGLKSELVHCLEDLASTNSVPITVDTLIVDGAAIINMLKPGGAKSFQDYADTVVLPYIESRLQNISRLDIVWDVYQKDSLKANARNQRGKGVRRRVEATSLVPKNWQGFLRVDDNKTELFSFLATRISNLNTSKEVITTHNASVLCVNREGVQGLAPCSHEEADTRMLLHLEDAVRQGHTKISIRTVDTDVVVLAISAAQRLGSGVEVWIAFGTGKNFRHIPAHEIARVLGKDRCAALPMFHSFTGCDNVSFFGGRGKRTAWNVWKVYDEVTPAFCALASTPALSSIEQWLQPIEQFVVLLYDRTSSLQMPGGSCSPKKGGQLMVYLLPKQR